MQNIQEYVIAHQQACEVWEHGQMVDHWLDEAGNLCIRYEDGKWWHYRMIDEVVEWW